MNVTELIQRATDIAVQGIGAIPTAISVEAVAEALLPSVFTQVAGEQAANPRTRSLLRRTTTVLTASGIAVLDSVVLTSYLIDSTLIDPADLTKSYAFINNWNEFITEDAGLLGFFCVRSADDIYIVEPAAAYQVGAGSSISYELTTPCVAAIPANATDPIGIIGELDNDYIEALASALKLGVKAAVSAARNT